MEQKLFQHEINFEIKETGVVGDYFIFEGYGSTKDLDLVNDIVKPSAFKNSIAEKMPVMLWQHDRKEPVGIYEDAKIDRKGLKVRGKMPLADSFVKDRVIPQIKIGSIQGLSIGFYAKVAEFDKETGIRTIKEVDLQEISLVTFPANPQATITTLKSFLEDDKDTENKAINTRTVLPKSFADRGKLWDKAAAEKRVREWAGTGEEPNKKYKNTFLWYDADNLENFTAYKFLVSDVIDGQIKIVPRAVFASRAVLSGARGGTTILEADQEKMKSVINTLYKEMDMDPPFGNNGKAKSFCLTELKCLSKSILAGVFRYCELSKEASDQTACLFMTDEVVKEFSNDLDGLNNALENLRKTLKNKEANYAS